MLRDFCLCSSVLAALLGSTPAYADAPPTAAASTSFESRFGLPVAERLLASTNEPDRLRAIERLGALGNAQALERIGQALDAEAGKSSRLRLVAVRALARHAAEPAAHNALVRLMTSGDSQPGCAQELDRLVRGSAALALAATGRPSALGALGQALRHEGPAALAAAEAVRAHPPRDLEPLLGARGGATISLVDALESLGDQRAFDFLRHLVRAGNLPVRARAAVALTRLGDFETIELGRHWLAHEKAPELRQAAAWVLALGHAAEAPRAIAELLQDPAQRSEGLKLALAFPHTDLVPTLERRLESCTEDCEAWLTAMGRAGGQRATRWLAQRLGDSRLGRSAAYALALAPGESARKELERAIGDSSLRAVAARAAVVRTKALGERIGGLEGALNSLLGARDPDQRAAGAWGIGTIHPERVGELLSSRDPVVVRAAARSVAGGRNALLAAKRWTVESDAVTRVALGVGISVSEGSDRVPTDTLLARLDQGDPLAPLLARALASRDSADLRPVVEGLLSSGDPQVRGHTALGLARSRHPGAIALLDQAYRFEIEPRVRRAIVTALSARSETARRRTLELAARLDSDPDTRAAARWALAERVLVPEESGTGVFWLDLVNTEAEARPPPTVALVTTTAGGSVPALADPGGLVVVTGLPRGSVTVRLSTLAR
jgi:hypothetical protein